MRVYYGGFRFCCPEDTTVCLATTPSTGVANRAPVVDAGRDQTVSVAASAPLDGTVMDDDAPVPLASVQATWSKQSGPGTVTFANANAVDTTARFSAPGTYVLVLTASDTALTTSDTVVVTVSASDGGAGGSAGQGGAGGSAGGGAGGTANQGGAGGSAGQGQMGGFAGQGGETSGSGGVPELGGSAGSSAGATIAGRGGSSGDAGTNEASGSGAGSSCGCRIGWSETSKASFGLAFLAVCLAARRMRRRTRSRQSV